MSGLSELPPTFTTGQARAAGVQSRDLYRARDDGMVIELSRGVFRRADAPAPRYADLLALAHRAPRAVVCLLSAARLHDLTDELPAAVQIAVPRNTWAPSISFPPVEVFRWDPDTFETGVEQVVVADGEFARVYSPPRTVVDLMRLRSRIGEPVAHIALQRFVNTYPSRLGELSQIARALDVGGPVHAALDVLTAS
jgi:hypothetical protein